MRSNCILQKHLFTWECWTLVNHMYNIMLVDSPSQHGEYNDAKTPDVNGSIIALLLQYLERLMNNTDKYCPPKYTHTHAQPYHTHTHACIHTSTRTRTHTHACAHTPMHAHTHKHTHKRLLQPSMVNSICYGSLFSHRLKLKKIKQKI